MNSNRADSSNGSYDDSTDAGIQNSQSLQIEKRKRTNIEYLNNEILTEKSSRLRKRTKNVENIESEEELGAAAKTTKKVAHIKALFATCMCKNKKEV